MQPKLDCLFIILFLLTFQPANSQSQLPGHPIGNPATIGNIPLPAGYLRMETANGSFATWLRQLPLKKDRTVYLFNGKRKRNQQAQYAVVDLQIGTKDLQQCADVVMRLRAEYLYENKKIDQIDFSDNNQNHYRLNSNCNRAQLDAYLERVFMFCGTSSLEKQLRLVQRFESIMPGDVLIKGGSPGHAIIVADVAIHSNGQKLFLLAQGYMPAQDMHVLINPVDNTISPWYKADIRSRIITPEWIFEKGQLRTW